MDDLVFTALAIKPRIQLSWYAHPKRKTRTRHSPYGASTIKKSDGSCMPSENELASARQAATGGKSRAC
jgi:hypothetical protein